jgi:Spy/CpxP family protein refolding chaperone
LRQGACRYQLSMAHALLRHQSGSEPRSPQNQGEKAMSKHLDLVSKIAFTCATALGAMPTAYAFDHVFLSAQTNYHYEQCTDENQEENINKLRDTVSLGIRLVLDWVDATEEQLGKTDAIVAQKAPEIYAQICEHHAVKQELHAFFASADLPEPKYTELRDRAVTNSQQMKTLVLDSKFEVAKVLTPEQRATLAEILQKLYAGGHESMPGDMGGNM